MSTHNGFVFWFLSHARAFQLAYREITEHPISNGFNMVVLSIAIALPLMLFALLHNFQFLHQHFDTQTPAISLYTQPGAEAKAIKTLLNTLQKNDHIAQVSYISPDENLKQFMAMAHLNKALSLLPANPLPGIIEVLPTLAYQKPDKINFLLQSIKDSPLIASAQVDMDWIKRLLYLIQIGNIFTMMLAIFFGAGGVLIISNLLKHTVSKYAKEIEILTLLGATNAFIRKPFIYFAILYSIMGSILAVCFTNFFIYLLDNPVSEFAQTYHLLFHLKGISLSSTIAFMILCTLLIYCVSLFFLRNISPSSSANLK